MAFTRQNPAFLRCYRFTVFSSRSQPLSPFLPSSESSSPSRCSTHGQLHWIDLIKICPLPPELAGSSLTHAPTHRQKSLVLQPHAPTRRPTPPRALTCSHTPHAHVLSHLLCHVNPSDVSTVKSALLRHEITHLITVILDGPTSYHAWSQNIIVFLKRRRLWRYVTSDIPKPVSGLVTDSDSSDGDSVADAVVQVDDFETRLEEWESIQCRILSWFINTSVLAISSLLPQLETGQAAWSFLATRYNCTYNFALEFYIEVKLYQMRQESAAMSSAPVDDHVVTVSQLESMFHRYMSQPSSVLSVTSGSTDGQAAWDRP
uniref:Retrotransposon Copia-like N-terminal domain-containing protein n=1 Tax=Fagus sylvatica TaxID=28930 RepID=A0A2N9H722_FAGSY